MTRLVFFACVASVALSWQSAALAAEGAIEEIIVTATKREESIQDVPIAVTAITGEDLTARGIQDVYDLQQVVPSLLINDSNSTTNGGTMRIRGIGTTGNNVGLESAVGTFIDGIYRSRAGQALNDLVDVERIEVLRGPQGTLFGKNTSAGAVNVVSKKPDFDFGGSAGISAGNFDAYRVEGTLNLPAIDEILAFRLAGNYSQRDGYYENIDNNKSYNDRDRYAVKGQMLWTPNDALSVHLIADYIDRDETCCPASYRFVGPTGNALRALGAEPVISRTGRVGVNADPFEKVEDKGAALQVDYDLEFGTLTSVTGYRDFDVERGQDVDFSNVDLYQLGNTRESFKNWSEELRLAGTVGDFDWLVGGYIYKEEIDNAGGFLVLASQGPAYFNLLIPGSGALLAPGNGLSAAFQQEGKGWSLFTRDTWHATDRFDVTIGVRFSDETKDGSSLINETGTAGVVDNNWPCAVLPIPTFCGNAGFDDTRDESEEWSGSLSFAYQITDDTNAYVSYARGFKSGGFNLDPTAIKINATTGAVTDASQFDAEVVDTYEIGTKSSLLDGRLNLNATVFYSQFQDFQLNTFTGAFFVVQNVPEVNSSGVEVEYQWNVVDGVFLTGGVTYADSRYDRGLIVNATAPIGTVPGCLTINPANRCTDLDNQRVTNSPLWQASTGVLIDQELPFWGGMRYTANANWAFRSSLNTGSDLDPEKQQGSYSIFNGQIGLRTSDDRYEVTLWGQNLTDKEYRTIVFDSVSQTGSWSTFVGSPRMWGVTLKTNF